MTRMQTPEDLMVEVAHGGLLALENAAHARARLVHDRGVDRLAQGGDHLFDRHRV